MYRALRDHDPVHHVVPEDKPDHDYYVMTRHADIWAAARDHETFSSALGLTVNYGELELIGLADNPPMVMQDPPVHTEFRKLVSRGFTPRQVEAVEVGIAALLEGDHAQALGVVVEAAMRRQRLVERPLPRMPEGRMAEIMAERDRLGEILVEAERTGD